MNLDPKAKYRDSHEWARPEGEVMVCGVTDHAQEELSDVVYVELPEVGATLDQGTFFGVIESVKAASDLYMPMSGTITEVNEALEEEPEIINSDPFGAGWMMKFSPTKPDEWDGLLDGEGYKAAAAAGA